MSGVRHRCYIKDRPGKARAIPPRKEVPPQFRPGEPQASRTPDAPRKGIGSFLQSKSADYESNS
jgi:hypothetical protein